MAQQTIEIRIPQLGEGLQEARLLRFLKRPGESVRQDEPVYEMETDKAVMEIEAPAGGVLESWAANEGDVLPIGAMVGRIASDAIIEPAADSAERVSLAPIPDDVEAARVQVPRPTSAGAPAEPRGPLRNADVPPRTRAYAREQGVEDDALAALAARKGGRLLPADIDRYLADEATVRAPAAPGEPPPSGAAYSDIPFPQRQRALVFHMQRSADSVIPASIEMPVDWGAVEAARTQLQSRAGADPRRVASHFLIFAWCVARSAADHPRFRSAVLNESTVRQYDHLHIGIAVSRPHDELVTARVADADTLGLDEFAAAAQAAIDRARAGEDQSTDAMQLSLTNLASYGVRTGIPIVVAPAVATLFVGAPVDEAYPLAGGGLGFRRTAHMVLSFDHRVINGAGAARFLSEVCRHVSALATDVSSS